MRYWLERHRVAVLTTVAGSLALSVAVGALIFVQRRPQTAPIVFQAITPFPTGTRAPTSTPLSIKVYVSGAVAHPGVYALPWDSRVEHAIAAAGYATSEADLVRVNLAQRVHDEQQIYVPCQAEDATPVLPTTVAPGLPSGGSAPSLSTININTASAIELQELPGIGPVLASRIIEYRETHGPFRKPEDIRRVSGIGDATFEKMADLITLD